MPDDELDFSAYLKRTLVEFLEDLYKIHPDLDAEVARHYLDSLEADHRAEKRREEMNRINIAIDQIDPGENPEEWLRLHRCFMALIEIE